MKQSKEWFAVDRAGLAKILQRRGIEFAVFELIQNAFDEDGVSTVDVTLASEGIGRAILRIADNAPAGFQNLAHSFTLFAESAKKSNPEKRGRFNLGEKLVLALCSEATIFSTTGRVTFDATGRKVRKGQFTSGGTSLVLHLKMSRPEIERVSTEICKLIPPATIRTTFNGSPIVAPAPVAEFTAPLPTEISDTDGGLRKTIRQTTVRVYEVAAGESAFIYEMGIPVVEHDCAYHCDVQQKVPVSLDRENVSTPFLKALRVAVLNATHSRLTSADMSQGWAQNAIESKDATAESVCDYMDKRFGTNRVSFDPSDMEANKRAVSAGYTVVHGSMLSADAWANVRQFEAIRPASKVTPSAKAWDGEDNPDAEICPAIPRDKWTQDMRDVAEYAERFALATIDGAISVRFYNSPHMLASAAYGGRGLSFNKFRLGNRWFNLADNRLAIDDLLIHELGHEYSSDHLSADYYRALTKVAARAVAAARKGLI